MATPSNILAWRIPWTEGSLAGYSLWGHEELDMTEHTGTHTHTKCKIGSGRGLWAVIQTEVSEAKLRG